MLFESRGMELDRRISHEYLSEMDGCAVKDICIDEGVPVKEKIFSEDVGNGFGSFDKKLVVEWPVPEGLKSSVDEGRETESFQSKVLIHQSEPNTDTTGLVLSNLLKEKVADTISGDEINKVELPLQVGRSPIIDACLPQKLAFDYPTDSAQLQRDQFDSSFASIGPFSGSISYSGHIPHSGSLSHCSDASLGSTRSFAFPVLKNEWNFSPARMRKADRPYLRRIRGRIHGLLCFKF